MSFHLIIQEKKLEDNNQKSKFQKYNIYSKTDFYKNAFCRNIGFLTEKEQKKLENFRIAIPGMGGVGALHLITMVRSGVGKFNIADFDWYEPVNFNRQFGANISSVDRPKVEVMGANARLINPYLEVNTFDKGINSENLDLFLQDVDLVIDGLDFFCFDIRRELFNRARAMGIPTITAGPMGFSCAMLIFSPDRGMGFDEYFNISDKMTDEEKRLSFALGLAPRATHIKYMDFSKVDLKHEAGPSLSVACQLCAGMAGTEALRILLDRKGIKPAPYYSQFDPFSMKFRKGRLFLGNKNPIQRLKIFIVNKTLQARKKYQKQKAPDIPDNTIVTEKILSEQMKTFLLDAGIQAPSGDNAQPWKFTADSESLTINLDPDADSSFFNVKQIASMISCGAVMENIKIAASQAGLKTKIKYSIDEDNQSGVLSFTREKIQPDYLYDYIWERHTNRTMFKKDRLSNSVISNCKNTISDFPNSRLYCITKKPEIKKIARIIYKIDRIRTEHKPLHEHLNKMIRFDSDQENILRDGLPLKNLQAGIAGEMFLKFTKPWPVMNILNKTGLGRMVALHSYKGALNSSAIMLLATDSASFEDFLHGGRALQRVWLELTASGYHVQPMTAVTLFLMRLLFEEGDTFSRKHLRLLESIKEDYYRLFPGLKPDNGQVLLFRVGHGKRINHFTKRKTIETLLKK